MGTKTDNDLLADKVRLRVDHAPWPADGRPLRVLDVFGGHGIVWAAVGRIASKPIWRTGIDCRQDLDSFHLHGDNRQVLSGLDLASFDAIDCDAYGIPADTLRLVFRANFSGTVFFTAIQIQHGILPKSMLMEIGFPEAIITKAPSLPPRRGWELFRQWLAIHGVRRLVHRSHTKRRKHYGCFRIGADPQ